MEINKGYSGNCIAGNCIDFNQSSLDKTCFKPWSNNEQLLKRLSQLRAETKNFKSLPETKQILTELFENNRRLIYATIKSCKKKFSGDSSEVKSLACEAFLKAVFDFDLSLGNKFSSFFVVCIQNKIAWHYYLNRQHRRVRLTPEFNSQIPDKKLQDPASAMDHKLDIESKLTTINKLLSFFPEQYQTIFYLYMGYDKNTHEYVSNEFNFKNIASYLASQGYSISKQHVHQIYTKILKFLRENELFVSKFKKEYSLTQEAAEFLDKRTQAIIDYLVNESSEVQYQDIASELEYNENVVSNALLRTHSIFEYLKHHSAHDLRSDIEFAFNSFAALNSKRYNGAELRQVLGMFPSDELRINVDPRHRQLYEFKKSFPNIVALFLPDGLYSCRHKSKK